MSKGFNEIQRNKFDSYGGENIRRSMIHIYMEQKQHLYMNA